VRESGRARAGRDIDTHQLRASLVGDRLERPRGRAEGRKCGQQEEVTVQQSRQVEVREVFDQQEEAEQRHAGQERGRQGVLDVNLGALLRVQAAVGAHVDGDDLANERSA
jgi:hypothetical protein